MELDARHAGPRLSDAAAVATALDQLDDRDATMPNLTRGDWSLAESLVKVLEPVKKVTEFLSQERHATVGLVHSVVYALLHEHLAINAEDSETISVVKSAAKFSGLWSALDDTDVPDLMCMGVFLGSARQGLWLRAGRKRGMAPSSHTASVRGGQIEFGTRGRWATRSTMRSGRWSVASIRCAAVIAM